jgi:hypothetical protein
VAIKNKYYIKKDDNLGGTLDGIINAMEISAKYKKPARIKYRSSKTLKDAPIYYNTIINIEFFGTLPEKGQKDFNISNIINFSASFKERGNKFNFRVDRIEEIEILNL